MDGIPDQLASKPGSGANRCANPCSDWSTNEASSRGTGSNGSSGAADIIANICAIAATDRLTNLTADHATNEITRRRSPSSRAHTYPGDCFGCEHPLGSIDGSSGETLFSDGKGS
jgi:hypothetical protein